MKDIISRKNCEDVIAQCEEKFANAPVFSPTNKAYIIGRVEASFHPIPIHGNIFYMSRVMVKRLSGTIDYVPIVVSKSLLPNTDAKGKWVEVAGQFQSCNKIDADGCRHLLLYLFAEVLNVYHSKPSLNTMNNLVYFDGFLCKAPVYRHTHHNHEITDLHIAINRPNKFSDYIPCISWGNLAYFCNFLNVGDHVTIYGRIQSRIYMKNTELKTAYEISIFTLKKMWD